MLGQIIGVVIVIMIAIAMYPAITASVNGAIDSINNQTITNETSTIPSDASAKEISSFLLKSVPILFLIGTILIAVFVLFGAMRESGWEAGDAYTDVNVGRSDKNIISKKDMDFGKIESPPESKPQKQDTNNNNYKEDYFSKKSKFD